MSAAQNETECIIKVQTGNHEIEGPGAKGGRKVALASIAEQWIKRLTLGVIRYDPQRVQAKRLVASTESKPKSFKAILNGNRQARLEKKAA